MHLTLKQWQAATVVYEIVPEYFLWFFQYHLWKTPHFTTKQCHCLCKHWNLYIYEFCTTFGHPCFHIFNVFLAISFACMLLCHWEVPQRQQIQLHHDRIHNALYWTCPALLQSRILDRTQYQHKNCFWKNSASDIIFCIMWPMLGPLLRLGKMTAPIICLPFSLFLTHDIVWTIASSCWYKSKKSSCAPRSGALLLLLPSVLC